MRKEITDVLVGIGRSYQDKGLVSGFEITQDHDVHGFYRLSKNPDKVIHIQAYPGLSSQKEMCISVRLREYDIMLQERIEGIVPVGNEHKANIPDHFLNMQGGIKLPYSIKEIQEALEKECKLL